MLCTSWGPLSRRLCAVVLALVAVPSAARSQAATDTGGVALPAAAADSLDAWRLSAPALAARCHAAVTGAERAIEAELGAAVAGRAAFPRLQAIEQVNAEVQLATVMPRSLQVIATDAAVRDTAGACDQLVTKLYTAVNADPRLYALARRAEQELATRSRDSVSAADRRLARLYVEQGRQAGAGLDSAARARVVGLFRRRADLERDYTLALAGDSTRIRIPLRDTLPLEAQLRAQLERSGDSASVKVDESTYQAFLEQASDRAARARFFRAFNERGGQANVARLDSALAVRDTLARVLGFRSWAAYQLSTRMAGTPQRVLALLATLKAPLRAKAEAEVARLRPLARRDGVTGPFELWDYGYYLERLRRTRYALSQDVVRRYFPVNHVLPAVMDLYSQLLGVRFREVTPAKGWAPEVSLFMVVDSVTGEPLGRLYFDLYPRPHKYDHFADFTVKPGFRRADGSRQLPWTAIVGNWSTPAPGRPSLLTHRDVVTLFHEFGHAMAAVLDRSPYATTSVYRQDFVEAPSQMLENWLWQPAILRRVSRHVATGAALPDSLIRRILALKHLRDGVSWGSQLFFATYDMTLHTVEHRVDPTATYFALYPEFVPFTLPAGTVPEASFGHIMGGYDAGYYGYLWAKIYAQDMFSRFEKDGILDPRAGRAYRDQILAPSGTEEPDVLVRRFLGRPLSPAAFYRELGLTGRGR